VGERCAICGTARYGICPECIMRMQNLLIPTHGNRELEQIVWAAKRARKAERRRQKARSHG
jgi:hypothetical protein